ncbi:MAG TPA: beta-hexosaminidase, partial [Paracoccus sp.]|nr:beta-hexosaminidase [Paracoccus sp. (in: a-proteobacteria)]
ALGFGGLLMSDDIGMNALGGEMAERATRARAAGCDIVLHCSGEMAEMEAVARAAGVLRGAAWGRAQAALAARRVPAPIDIAAAAAELEVLGGAAEGLG